MGIIFRYIIPAVWVVLTIYMMRDCRRFQRESFWYLVLLIPGWGVVRRWG